jgi:carbon-monoxide dehydrogenase medium subunit
VKPAPFAYRRPATLEEALSLLAEHGNDAKVIAGGQSLIPLLNLRLSRPALLVDINRLPGLDALAAGNGILEIGALARHADVEHAPETRECCPLLHEALPNIGHAAIRNRGTIGGSIAHADPAAELPAVACALGATVAIVGPSGAREIAAEDFFITYLTTALEPDELVVALRFPRQAARTGSCWLEFARRQGDFALAGVAALVAREPDGRCAWLRVACAGVGEKPLVAARAGPFAGESETAAAFADFAESVAGEADPPSDLHGSAWYRRKLLGELVRRALATAFARAGAA